MWKFSYVFIISVFCWTHRAQRLRSESVDRHENEQIYEVLEKFLFQIVYLGETKQSYENALVM